MRDFPSCFGESGVQITDSASSSSTTAATASSAFGGSQNSVTCLYHARIGGAPCLITVTWTKSLVGGASLSISIQDPLLNRSICPTAHVKPSLFSKNKGSRAIPLLFPSPSSSSSTIHLLWDLSSASFPASSPEPLSSFYVAFFLDLKPFLLLGDLAAEACRRIGVSQPLLAPPLLLTRREHLSGRRLYTTTAEIAGGRHDIAIECEFTSAGEPSMEIRVDKRRVVLVRRLLWKFRGNQSIVVGEAPVEIFWDVHAWFFSGLPASAVFVFAERPEGSSEAEGGPWAEGGGFSLVLYAWRD